MFYQATAEWTKKSLTAKPKIKGYLNGRKITVRRVIICRRIVNGTFSIRLERLAVSGVDHLADHSRRKLNKTCVYIAFDFLSITQRSGNSILSSANHEKYVGIEFFTHTAHMTNAWIYSS